MNCCLLSHSRTDYAAICKYSICTCNNVTVTYVSHMITYNNKYFVKHLYLNSSDILQVVNKSK